MKKKSAVYNLLSYFLKRSEWNVGAGPCDLSENTRWAQSTGWVGCFFYSISLHANANAMDLLWGEVNNILLYFLLYIVEFH